MKLKLDTSKTYGIALEGGGAKGAYEIGVWKALDEAGVKYNAVSGTSVGALNGALMVMRDLPRAIDVWSNMQLNKVISLDPESEEDMRRVMKGELELSDIQELIPQALGLIRNRGLDVSPLRAWVREVVDREKVLSSDVAFYVSTLNLSDRKAMEVNVKELEGDEVYDMLLASAYHPSFRLEPLGGKLYTDGGFVDTVPIHALVQHGCKDIIAVRIPGMGLEKKFDLPDDVTVTEIHTYSDLGGVLNFDAEQAKLDMEIGYFDAKRVLYGLSGKKYYVERSITEMESLRILLDKLYLPGENLRDFCEKELPRLARKLDAEDGDYYDMLIAAMEQEAERRGINRFRIYTDRELYEMVWGEDSQYEDRGDSEK